MFVQQRFPFFKQILAGLLFSGSALFAAEGPNPTALEPPRLKDPKEIVGLQQQTLDHLIEMTKASLKEQLQLKELLDEYRKVQDRYLENPQDKERLYKMVKTAYRLQERIKEYHLAHSFDPEFMSELKMLANIAAKIGIPKP